MLHSSSTATIVAVSSVRKKRAGPRLKEEGQVGARAGRSSRRKNEAKDIDAHTAMLSRGKKKEA
jgi:hypothetical protein